MASISIPFFRSRRVVETSTRVLATIILILLSAIVMLPVFWMISTSLKSLQDVLKFPPIWIPNQFMWSNYPEALTFLPFHIYFRNTVLITFAVLIADVFVNSLIAYAFARLRAPGKEILFILVISTMMVPYQVLMTPLYIIFHRLGWIDTYRPLIIPAFFGSAFLIFMLRQFYRGIPSEMDDSARIDGCSYLGIWLRIIIPLSLPALAAASIFSFTYNWNDFLAPLIYINSPEKMTLAVGLAYFRHRYSATPWHLLMAATITTVLPCVILFFTAQRYFIQGVVITGVKG